MRKAQISTSPSDPNVKTRLLLEKASAFTKAAEADRDHQRADVALGRRLQA